MIFLNRDLAYKLEAGVQIGNKELVVASLDAGLQLELPILELPDVVALYGGPESHVNEAVGLGLSASVEEVTLEAIEDFYFSHDHPAVLRVCSVADPSVLELARKRGYALKNFSYRWILDLESWVPELEHADPRVRRADPGEELVWARTVSAGFADREEVSPEENLALDRALFRMSNGTPILAMEDGVPAGGGMLAAAGDTAALFATSTRPSYRRRGLQTAMLDWRLRFAKEQGSRMATIETDPGSDSQRNVERMGFRLAYAVSQLVKSNPL